MMWFCSDWNLNWSAIAAISTATATAVALTFGVSGLVGAYFRRRGEARVIELLIGPELGRNAGHLHRTFIEWQSHEHENVSAFYDATIWASFHARQDLKHYLTDLQHPLLAKHIERAHVLPRPIIVVLVKYLDCLECFKRQLKLVSDYPEDNNEFVSKGFAQCRAFLNELIILGWQANELCGHDSSRPFYRGLRNLPVTSALEIVRASYNHRGQRFPS